MLYEDLTLPYISPSHHHDESARYKLYAKFFVFWDAYTEFHGAASFSKTFWLHYEYKITTHVVFLKQVVPPVRFIKAKNNTCHLIKVVIACIKIIQFGSEFRYSNINTEVIFFDDICTRYQR